MSNVCGESDLYGGTLRSRRRFMGSAGHWNTEHAALQHGDVFRIRVNNRNDEVCILELSGELDIVSMAYFERVLAEVLSRRPREITFDLTDAQFISAQGYSAIGRCSLEVRVAVLSRTELASKILGAYGYDRVVIIMASETGA